jgi:hypothetical protein
VGTGVGVGVGVGVGLTEAAALRLGIALKVRDSVERCCGSGRAVGDGNTRLAIGAPPAAGV